MAYTTIDNPADYFNTVLYTGTGSNNSITGVGFQPDWVWQKRRDSSANHELTDSVRGINSTLVTNSSNAQDTGTDKLQSFDSDGFTAGSSSTANASGGTYASWNWYTGATASSNTDGSITSSVSANTTAGFSIVSWTGTQANATVGHGLGSTPKMIIIKCRDSSDAWFVYHEAYGATKYLILNTTAATVTASTPFNDTAPTSSVFSLGADGNTNESGSGMIAYCFAEKKGYSKFGSYTGNGNADGTFVYTGFKPAFVIHKRFDATNNWHMVDNKRDTFNPTDLQLYPNVSNSEFAETDGMDFLSNGFKARESSTWINASGGTYIYMAFAESPFVTAGTKAAGTAR